MAGLSLTRKENEVIVINETTKITVQRIFGTKKVSLRIEAPAGVTVVREEILARKQAGEAKGVRA